MSSTGTEDRLWFAALKATLEDGYERSHFGRDVLAGLTIGVIAIPLAMALAVASGAPPQQGLYTSVVAGFLIALCGGSRYNVSGPTAAFVVILLPITQQHGLGGLLIVTLMSGVLLVAMGLARLGRLIQFVPHPVVIGFTAGIGVVIATLQLKDLLGLSLAQNPTHYLDKLALVLSALPLAHWQDALIGAVTFLVLLLWPRYSVRVPAHLMALITGGVVAWLATQLIDGFSVATIGSRFHWYHGAMQGVGIPPLPPLWVWPWQLPDASGQPVGLSYGLIRELMAPALAVAMLGAIESLLCAVVADGVTGKRHNPNGELIGQGIGNIVVPFFGGITATAAIARTAANIRNGAHSPVAAMVHALTVLLAIVLAAPLMAYVPMATLAALLVMVAWTMSDAGHFLRLTRTAPRSDVLVLWTCFILTVLFDMVLAVSVGLLMASVLFIKRMSEATHTSLMQTSEHEHLKGLPADVVVYDVNGPLFFGAAEQALSALNRVGMPMKVVVLDMSDVPMVDVTAIVALDSALKQLKRHGVPAVLHGLDQSLIRKLARAGLVERPGQLVYTQQLADLRAQALALRAG